MGEELTIHEAAADPLIGQILQADGVPQRAFAQLLQSAARLRAAELAKAIIDVHGETELGETDELPKR